MITPADRRRTPRPRADALLLLLIILLLSSVACLAGPHPPALGAANEHGWTLSSGSGFAQGRSNTQATKFATYLGKTYCSTVNWNGDGAQLWETANGPWTKVPGTPWSGKDTAIYSMVEFKGRLYIGTLNIEEGCGLWSFDGSAWADALGTGGAGGRGFNNRNNLAVTAMGVFGESLFVGTTNIKLDEAGIQSEGASVYRLNGTTGAWSLSASAGGTFGDFFNIGISSFAQFNGRLYASTIRARIGFVQIGTGRFQLWLEGAGFQLWSTDITGAWRKEQGNGIIDPRDLCAVSMIEHLGQLHVGTLNGKISIDYTGTLGAPEYDSNGLGIYTVNGDGAWDVLVKGGFDDAGDAGVASMEALGSDGNEGLAVGTTSSDGPGKLKLYRQGAWVDGALPGFGNPHNTAISALVLVNSSEGSSSLFAGTTNADQGCEVWAGRPENTESWYLAEGSTKWGFDTYINIQNPNEEAVIAYVTFMTDSGELPQPPITLPPMSQTVINPAGSIGSRDFSTKVESHNAKRIAVDRRMIWTGEGAASSEGHSSIGARAPAGRWYLAEGSSRWGFETWLLIQNPGEVPAACTVTYMIEGGDPVEHYETVMPGTRTTLNMADTIGEADASIMVESAGAPVICERAMYRNNRREGHGSIGVTTPSKHCFLAEGTTAWGFTTYVLIQNPNDFEATVNIACQTPAGARNLPAIKVAPWARKTVRVNDHLPGTDLSTALSSDLPIVAERAMYWNTASGEACHGSIGTNSPHCLYYLPDGETRNGHETWTLVQNPDNKPVSVEISYLTPSGKNNRSFTQSIPANSRMTFDMSEKVPNGRAAVLVRSLEAGRGIVVERAIYWNQRGAGTDTVGGFSD